MEHYAHDAMGDVLATIELAKIIKEKIPEVWEQSLSNCHKNEVENFLFENDFFLNFEYNFGRANFNFLTYICSHPKYKYPQCYDVSIDPKDLLNLNELALMDQNLNSMRSKYKSDDFFSNFMNWFSELGESSTG